MSEQVGIRRRIKCAFSRCKQSLVNLVKKYWRQIIAIIIVIYVVFFLVISYYLRAVKEDTVASVGQLLADWLLFPTVLIGFWITIREFRQAQVKPNLKLFWTGDMGIEPQGDDFVLYKSKHTGKEFRLLLHVRNNGKLVAPWYHAVVELPTSLVGIGFSSDFGNDMYEMRWGIGDKSNHLNQGNLQANVHSFKGNPQFAIYPGEQIHIATLILQVSRYTKPSQETIAYSIATDRTETIRSEVEILIKEEDPSIWRPVSGAPPPLEG